MHFFRRPSQMHPSSEKGTMAKKNNITVKIITSLSLIRIPLKRQRKPSDSVDLKKATAVRIQQNTRTDMPCLEKLSVASVEDPLREDTITLPMAEATMPGAVADILKIRVPVP